MKLEQINEKLRIRSRFYGVSRTLYLGKKELDAVIRGTNVRKLPRIAPILAMLDEIERAERAKTRRADPQDPVEIERMQQAKPFIASLRSAAFRDYRDRISRHQPIARELPTNPPVRYAILPPIPFTVGAHTFEIDVITYLPYQPELQLRHPSHPRTESIRIPQYNLMLLLDRPELITMRYFVLAMRDTMKRMM